MNYSALLFEVRQGVAHVTLNRPEAANTINMELGKDLMDAALRCDEDPEIRAVLMSGNGKMFSGGGDIKSFQAQGAKLPFYVKELTTYLHAAISRFARMDPPLVVAVHGSAAGAGMSLACSGDIVLAAESARFTMAYTRIGLTPDGSSSYFLPRIVGLKRALDLALTNRVLSAREALEWGLVSRVVPEESLRDEATQLAVELAAGPTAALGATKRLFHGGWTDTLESQMEQETRVIADMTRTLDAQEGTSAFLAKRPPRFQGK